MKRNITIAVLSGLAGAALLASPSWSAGPREGMSLKYACSGPYGKVYETRFARVQNGMVRLEGSRDGKPTWNEKPVHLLGTTLFKKKDRNDGKGGRGQSQDEGDFASLKDHKAGSKFTGVVREWHNKGKWEWNYVIQVGDSNKITHDVLGDIEVVTISERRDVRGGNYRSQATFQYAPKIGTAVAWEYKDDKGTQKCELESFQ